MILQNKNLKSKIHIYLIFFLICNSLFAQDFWIGANGPEGGSIQALEITPDGQILAGTDGGGIFRSNNNGDDWNFAGLFNVDVQCFTVDTSGYVFAGTTEGIFRSDDNGNNWVDVNNGLSNFDISCLGRAQNNHIFAGTYGGGMFRSMNVGDNWTEINNGLSNLDVTSITINSQGHIFVGTDVEGVFRSTDNGDTWTRINVGLSELSITAITSKNINDYIFAATHNGIFRSVDNGANWDSVKTGLTYTDVISLTVDQGGAIMAGTFEGIFRSDNDGDNWYSANNGLSSLIVRSFVIKNASLIFAGTMYGVFRTTDSANNWTKVNNGLHASIVVSLIAKRNGHVFAGTEGSGLFRSLDNGGSWEQLDNGLFNPFILSLAVNSSGHVFAGTYDGVFRSVDNGDSWVHVNTNLNVGDICALAINSNDDIFAGTYDGVYRSVNNGDTWQRISSGLTVLKVNELVVSSSDVIFAACDSGGFFRSVNNGDSWTRQNTGLSNTDIISLTINSNDILFAGSYEGVFRSVDAGSNWAQVNNGLQGMDIFALQTDFVDRVYCGGYDGVFVSNNNGDFWTQISTGLKNLDIFSFCMHPNGYLFAGSFGGGSFRSQLHVSLAPPQLSSPSDAATDLPLSFELSWRSVTFATGYRVDVASDNQFTNLVFSKDTVTTNVTADVPAGATTYYWRVNATDGINTSFWSEVWRFTTQNVPVCTTQAASNVTATTATFNAMVNPNNIKIGVGFEYGLDTNYSNYVPGTPDSLSNASGNPVSAIVHGLIPNTTYHYRVQARSADATITEFGNDFSFTTGNYPSTINLSHTVDFPEHANVTDYQSSDYRIVGIPGSSDARIEDLLNGQHEIDWEVYWDNGGEQNYFVQFDGSSEFRFQQGRAFWMINRGNWNLNLTDVSTANVNGNFEAPVDLHDGWNLITNPFESPIDWDRVKALNGITEPIWGFDDSYSEFQYLEPYRGYYFLNEGNLNQILIPYRNILPKPLSNPIYQWQISIELSVGLFQDKCTKIGIAENANVEMDDLDYHKPRTFGDLPAVYIHKPEWDRKYSTFASDIRPPFSKLEKWDFSVSTERRDVATLTIRDVEQIPENHEVVLLDRVNSKYVDLKVNNTYQFKPVMDETNFEILVGDKELINQQISAIIPFEFKLGENFPNPFNPSTTIPVSVSKESELTLKIYNVLGQEVQTIFKGTKEIGKYYFKWDGTNYLHQYVSAGIYLYRLKTNQGHDFVGKMILVK